MSPEERPTKVAERCELHPNRTAVVHCAACDRPLCIRCAMPVRGRVLGPECLVSELGEESPAPAEPERERRSAPEVVAGVAFCLAAIASLLPWTRFASGSGFAGGWALDLRWSTLASITAVGSLACWIFGRRRGLVGLRTRVVLGLAGALGATMAIVNPPPFKHASITPFLVVPLMLTGVVATFRLARQASDLHR